MKIIIVANEFRPGPGGVGTHAYELASHLHEMGHSINVVCAQDYVSKEEKDKFNEAQKFHIHPYPEEGSGVRKFLKRFLLFRKVLRTSESNLVLASGSNAVWIGAFYRVYLRTFKLVIIAHGGELTFRSVVRRNLTLWGCRIADHIISVSQYTTQYLPASTRKKTTVIHNGAHQYAVLPDREKIKTRYGFNNKRIILTIGSVSERKGQDIVIRSLPKIKSAFPETLYLMAGRSNTLPLFTALVDEYKLKDDALFLGAVSTKQLEELLTIADVFVLASRHSSDGDFEGFGIAVIEAALSGVPAIVTRDSGLVEAIEEGKTGYSVLPEDSDAVASSVIELLSDDEKRMLMGQAARQRAEMFFTWSKIAKEYENILNKL